MDVDMDNFSVEITISEDSQQDASEIKHSFDPDQSNPEAKSSSEGAEKHSAVWTTSATSTLLKLYETKLEMLETPKKKTRIWIAISDNLKEHNIEMTPDQVRWKINALAKKYKLCIDNGQHEKFKYFKEMDNIYSQYNVDCDSFTIQNAEVTQKRKVARKNIASAKESGSSFKSIPESKAMIELRKRRLASRIEADRSQSKISLEKQWLEYLKRQEEQKKIREEICERHLRLQEEELELRKKELEMKESIELRKLELREREQEDLLQLERQKCEMLKKLFTQQ